MKIFLTGSTGFVGKRILRDLLENKYQVRCLARKGSEQKISHYKNPVLVKTGIDIVNGDITDAASLDGKLEGYDAVINLVGIIREFRGRGITFERLHYEGTANLVRAARSQRVMRFVQMSALGARPDGKTQYQQTKFRAEECVRTSGLDYTIFRPSIIFGPEDKFVNLFANMLRTQQFVPVVGNGRYQMQPVSVENVSMGFVKAIEQKNAIGKTFDVGGPERIEFNRIIDIIGEVICAPPYKIHMPVFIMSTMAEMLDWVPSFPVTKDQITMLLEGNVCDERPFFRHFDVKPIGFKEGISKYLSA
ncbi:MAG TPA: complex I NDUFA9 subunit family protein [Candidatus Wunengus sp. YC65]|uniref:complex I NDUFA9 subunit family protein n=1 Tax=Candidatus Wunengus sp. YC65 TaxID=3367701 RepID=UPI004027A704